MRFEIRVMRPGSGAPPSGIGAIVVDAADAEQAIARAREQGYAVLGVRARAAWRALGPAAQAGLPLAHFSQELMTLLEAGLSLVEAMETLAEKEPRTERRQIIREIIASLYRGQSLSSALERFASIFGPLYIAMVRASEKTGGLPEALGRYVVYQGQVDSVKKKIISASIYPLLLAGVGALVILFLLAYVMPRFATIFEQSGGQAPLMSRLLIEWGGLMQQHGASIAAAAVALVAMAAYALTRPATRAAVIGRAERIPALGGKIRVYQMARFYRTVGMLLNGGMPILAALAMSRGLLRQALRARLELAMGNIREGMAISQAMEAHALVTAVSLRMLRVGERTGRMGEMMERIARFHDEEIARWVDWFARLFEPLLMAFIGVVIGAIVVLMYFPIFELAGSIR